MAEKFKRTRTSSKGKKVVELVKKRGAKALRGVAGTGKALADRVNAEVKHEVIPELKQNTAKKLR